MIPALTIDRTTIDSAGSGVANISGGGCSALGIAGRSGLGDWMLPTSSSISVFFNRPTTLGLCGKVLFMETRLAPDGRRGCGRTAPPVPVPGTRTGDPSSASNADDSIVTVRRRGAMSENLWVVSRAVGDRCGRWTRFTAKRGL